MYLQAMENRIHFFKILSVYTILPYMYRKSLLASKSDGPNENKTSMQFEPALGLSKQSKYNKPGQY